MGERPGKQGPISWHQRCWVMYKQPARIAPPLRRPKGRFMASFTGAHLGGGIPKNCFAKVQFLF